MKTFKTKQETRTIEEVTEIRCDQCGVVSKAGKHGEIPGMFPYIETIQIHYGYGSRHDMDMLEVDLCDDCIDNMLGSIGRLYENGIEDDIDPEYDGLV